MPPCRTNVVLAGAMLVMSKIQKTISYRRVIVHFSGMFRGMYSIPPNPSDSLHHNDDVVDSKCVPKMDTLCLGNDHFHA